MLTTSASKDTASRGRGQPPRTNRALGQKAEKSAVTAPTRDGLVNQDKAAATEATTTVKHDTPKRPIRDALAKIRQALRGKDNATSKAGANAAGQEGGHATTTRPGTVEKPRAARTMAPKVPKAKQHHKKQHESAGAANG